VSKIFFPRLAKATTFSILISNIDIKLPQRLDVKHLPSTMPYVFDYLVNVGMYQYIGLALIYTPNNMKTATMG